jgi:acyl-CoA synthetase (AMP-forming)/AMP-acid ligase II
MAAGRNIEFVGRNDFQVNVQGYRVELGEIEKVVTAHPKAHEAAVVTVEDKADHKRLVAYYTCRKSSKLGEDIVGSDELGKDVNDLREEFLQLGYEQQFQFVQRMLIREGVPSQSSARDEMTNLLDVFSRNSVAIDRYSSRPREQSVVRFAAADNESQII